QCGGGDDREQRRSPKPLDHLAQTVGIKGRAVAALARGRDLLHPQHWLCQQQPLACCRPQTCTEDGMHMVRGPRLQLLSQGDVELVDLNGLELLQPPTTTGLLLLLPRPLGRASARHYYKMKQYEDADRPMSDEEVLDRDSRRPVSALGKIFFSRGFFMVGVHVRL